MATDPALLSQYQGGQITYAQYQAAMQSQAQAQKTAAAIAALQQATTVSPTLIASEIALQKANLAKQQQQAARAAAERQRQAKAAAQLKAQQAAVDAARRAKDAKAAAEAAAALRQQQLSAADARASAAKAEQARRHAEEQRTAELVEQARQQMIAETGRVVNPEQEGMIIAQAMQKATGEADLAAGNYSGVSVHLADLPEPTYIIPGAAMRKPQPPGGSQKEPVYYPSLPTPPPETVIATDTARTEPGAYTPSESEGLSSPPSAAWEESYNPVQAPNLPEPGMNPYLYGGQEQKTPGSPLLNPATLLISGLILLTTGIWIGT